MVNDEKMRRTPRIRFKLIEEREKRPSAGTLAFPDRPELYELLAASKPDRDPE